MKLQLSRLFFIFVIGMVGFGSTPSFANRCEWNRLLNRAHCCNSDEQAIWNELFKRVECVESKSGDSCVWDNLLNRVRCCETDEHAVWNPQLHRPLCFRF